MSKQLLLGDEAIAQSALDAGLSGVYAYPGTPSTEITEYIQSSPVTSERNIHSRWAANEKTAMEAALGMSFVGKRALVCMKHVGMNVAADCFINSAIRSEEHTSELQSRLHLVCRLQVGDEIKFACVDGPEFDGHLVDFDQAMKRSQMYKTEEGRALLKLQEGDTHHGGCGHCGGDK